MEGDSDLLHRSADQQINISAEQSVSPCSGDEDVEMESSTPTETVGNRALKASLQSTPLSSLPPGSLMRHLVALREKQYLLNLKPLSGSPQVQNPVLTYSENPSPIELNCSAAKFMTSTPQLEFESPWNNQNEQKTIRHPLVELPLNTRSKIKNTILPAEVGHNHKLATTFSPPMITDENSPSAPTLASAEPPASRFYDPNIYRSPPKHTSSDGEKISVSEHQPIVDSYLVTNSNQVSVPRFPTESFNSSRDDDRPLSTSSKSFEELVSEKLEDKSYRPSSSVCPGPSKKFLKKGSGTSRFTSALNSSNNAGKFGMKESSSLEDSSVTAKPKFPFLKKGTGTRRYNIKSVRLKKSCGTQNFTPAVHSIVRDNVSHQTVNVECKESPKERLNIDGGSELDFMSPIQRVPFHRESEELKAFEALEELAEHSSFCSDASTVNSLLRRGLECSVSSTPAGSPSTRVQRYPTNILELEARRMASCIDSPHPQRGVGCVAREESTRIKNSESGGLRAKKSVQFCKQGAQFLEYHAHEDTHNDAPLSSDTSDFLNISDLEILNQMNKEGKLPATLRVESVVHSEDENPTTSTNVQRDRSSLRHQILQFSPPRMPPDAASYAVWEAFGKKTKSTSTQSTDLARNTSAKLSEETRKHVTTGSQNTAECPVSGDRLKEDELEAHKVLLVSKVHELEREIKTFQNENENLAKLRKTIAREKEMFQREKRLFEETLERERKNMEEQFEMEKNRLWRANCSLQSNKQINPQKDNILETINLKEEILMLKNELERRDSMNNFTVNKLRNTVKQLTMEKKDFESKVQKISSLEKENMSLKHQVDRLKLTARSVCDKPTAKPKPIVCERNSAPASSETGSQVRGIHAAKSCGNIPKQRSVSFVCGKLSSTKISASKKNASVRENAETGKLFSSMDSYLANSSCEVSGSATPSSSVLSSASALSYSEENMNDGSKVITYANGNKKQILPSGCVIDEYYNGDRKETYRDRVVYFYSFDGTKQTTYLDGSEELQFQNGQTEIKRADTSIEIIFPDRSKTVKLPDGTEVHHNSDGTVVTATPSGEKVFNFPSGQREVHGFGFKRREYPDGTSKVLYDDGISETTYPNGRIRVKDEHGNIVSDTKLGLDLTEKLPLV
ncbi:T-complex protein 10 C-terminal domain [Trinorchestia longiramus]|nr:T-complex protein 10 C-terminal domain [Trinorchestia longiramus]